MAKRKAKVTHFQLETDEEDEEEEPADPYVSPGPESPAPLEAIRKRRTTAYILAQLPSNRSSIVSLAGPHREGLPHDKQSRRSVIRSQAGAPPDALRDSRGSILAQQRKSVLYSSVPPKRSVVAKAPSSTHNLKMPRSGLLHHPPGEATAPMHAAKTKAKAKASVIMPLETLKQVAKELRIQQEKDGDYMSLSDSQSKTAFVAKEMSSSISGKDLHRQAAVAFRERLKSVAVPIAEKKAVRDRMAKFDKSISRTEALEMGSPLIGMIIAFVKSLDVWSHHFKEIEGRFGSATASFFRFTRWLIILNLCTFLVDFLVITVPFIAAPQPPGFVFQQQGKLGASPPSGGGGESRSNQSVTNHSKLSTSPYNFLQQAINCSNTYYTTKKESEADRKSTTLVLDVFLGTGWMETTTMFYGFYHNQTYESSGFTYNTGLAYILAIGTTFLFSFLLILVNSSQSVKQLVRDEHEQSTIHFTNSVLCGWDYSIFDYKSSNNRKNVLFQEFKADLLEQSKRLQRKNRTQRQKLVLLVVRTAVNTVALCIIAGSLFLIFYTTNFVLRTRQGLHKHSLRLMLQFLPSVTITILNAIIPEIFNGLVRVEDYRPSFALKLTILRTVFVRLSSLGVLTLSLYYTLLVPGSKKKFCAEEARLDSGCCGNLLWPTDTKVKPTTSGGLTGYVLCWETYVGQQFYRLAVVDFAALLAITFCVEFPRKFIYDTFKERSFLVKNFGQQEFDLPRNVLDIVYSQTLSWLGTFFAPLLPMMTLIKIVCVFYIKKWTLMKNYAPPQQVYKVSKSNSFFSFILLISFILVAVIITYMIGSVNPSKSCGPYRVYSVKDFVVWTSITDLISAWPHWASDFLFFFGTSAFFVPCFAVLCLLMYYFWALGEGYSRIEEILRDQLKLEEREREFLLGRVNDMIQQGFSSDTVGAKRDIIALGSMTPQSSTV